MEPYVLAVCGSPRKGGNCDILKRPDALQQALDADKAAVSS